MSIHYGQDIKFGVLGAPALFTGDNMDFSYRNNLTVDELEDGGSDITALAMHSRKGEMDFSGEVTDDSTDFLNLQAGARITVDASIAGIDLTDGAILASEAVEEWSLMRRKRCSIRATHYPDMENPGSGAAAASLSAFTPNQSSIDWIFPGGTVIYSTVGISHASGLVHNVRLTQSWKLTDDEPSPDGKILGAFASGYKRMISLQLLAKPASASIPAPKSVLTFAAAPANMANYRVTSAEPRLERAKGMMFQLEAEWIPGFA